MTSTAVVAYEAASLNDRMKYAQTLASAGDLIPKGLWSGGAPSPGKVLLVMETGAMLGMHPMAALQSIDVVEGRATLSAKLMSGLITSAGHRLEIIKTGTVTGGDYTVVARGTRADSGMVYESEPWDFPRAIRAGLVDSYKQNEKGEWVVRARSQNGNVKPWEAYAETQPVWRAVSEVARLGFSDVLFGLYSTEEMTDGGIPIADPDPEPTEDWEAQISAAETREQLDEIGARLKEKGEGTDKLKAAWLARAGFLKREGDVVDAEVVKEDDDESVEPEHDPAEPTEAEYAQMQAEAQE